MLDLGVQRQLEIHDLVHLPGQLTPSSCHFIFFACWIKEKNKDPSSPSLFKTMYSAYGWSYLRLGILKVCLLSFNVSILSRNTSVSEFFFFSYFLLENKQQTCPDYSNINNWKAPLKDISMLMT